MKTQEMKNTTTTNDYINNINKHKIAPTDNNKNFYQTTTTTTSTTTTTTKKKMVSQSFCLILFYSSVR